MSQPFRVLSLSGGGMRGVFSAAVLVELQDALRNHTRDPDARLIDYFDLIVGTSTGGLLALGLAFEKSPEELLAVYKTKGRKVFPPLWRNRRLWRLGPLIWPLYSQRRLREVVEGMVPASAKLGGAKVNLVLTAVDRESGGIVCLKTGHHPDFYRDLHMNAVEAGMATSAAPIAFPHVATERHGDLLDGGMWANTPILVGLIEAKRFFNRDLADVRVLSIGTTRAKLPPRGRWHFGGYLEYGGLLRGRLQELLWEGQRSLAVQAASLMLPDDGLVEIDHEFSGSGYTLMDSSHRAVRALENAGRDAAKRSASSVCRTFFAARKQVPVN